MRSWHLWPRLLWCLKGGTSWRQRPRSSWPHFRCVGSASRGCAELARVCRRLRADIDAERFAGLSNDGCSWFIIAGHVGGRAEWAQGPASCSWVSTPVACCSEACSFLLSAGCFSHPAISQSVAACRQPAADASAVDPRACLDQLPAAFWS